MMISRGEKEGEIIFKGEEGEVGGVIILYVSNTDKYSPLLALIPGKTEFSEWFNREGERRGYPNDKLYIKIKETETFEDKDILVGGSGFIFMLNTNGEFKTSIHVGLYTNGRLTFGGAAGQNDIEKFRRANMKERFKLMFALMESKDNRAIKLLNKLNGVEKKVDFKPFDKVLIKDEESDKWEASFFIRKVGELYECMLGLKYKYCIPFEGNEHLLENE